MRTLKVRTYTQPESLSTEAHSPSAEIADLRCRCTALNSNTETALMHPRYFTHH